MNTMCGTGPRPPGPGVGKERERASGFGAGQTSRSEGKGREGSGQAALQGAKVRRNTVRACDSLSDRGSRPSEGPQGGDEQSCPSEPTQRVRRMDATRFCSILTTPLY
jgi:hypothetical protein